MPRGSAGSHACISNHIIRFVVLLLSIPVLVAYLDEPMMTLTGFHVGEIFHEIATNQIVVNITMSIPTNTIPVMYISKEGWDTTEPDSDDMQQQPCVSGAFPKNDICCVNAVIEKYQVAPSMISLYNNIDICPYENTSASWTKNFTQPSSDNPQLSEHLMTSGVGDLDFLSTGILNNTNASLTYPEGVSYNILEVNGRTFTVELRMNHLYLKPRSRRTAAGSSSTGMSKYEFYIGVTFVNLLPYISGVSINAAQVSFSYFKSDFVFVSISTAQSSTPIERLDVVIHQGIFDKKQYQYAQFDFSYDVDLYPGPIRIKRKSLRWVKSHKLSDVADSQWVYPCVRQTGSYYTGDMQTLESLGEQTCLPRQPTFCEFDDRQNFFVPFPTEYATHTTGFIPGPDPINNLYIQFVVKFTDSTGGRHLATILFGIDLSSWVVMEHCQDTSFEYKSVADALKITATVGMASTRTSGAVLRQTVGSNRNMDEIVANSDL
jgi:hypothetical protein